MKTTAFLIFINLSLLASCTKDIHSSPEGNNGQGNNSKEWLIPKDEVRDGGPGKDGIPALNQPNFISVNEVSFLDDNDLVLGFADGDYIRAYPHTILDWHEIVNEKTQNASMAVIYCPLTGTGIGWNRIVNDKETTFGVSGLLYNSNIIPYDRETDSNWSQLLLKAVNGQLIGHMAETYNLLETEWKTWKEMYPNSKVLSTKTGYNRNYGVYPYGNYKKNEILIFPVNNTDNSLHKKERVLAIINDGKAIAFTFNKLKKEGDLFYDEFMGNMIVITGSEEHNLLVAFNHQLSDGAILSFEKINNRLPLILSDNEGNKWDVFGVATEGPRKGQKLNALPQMMGYWFAFAAFYPNIRLEK